MNRDELPHDDHRADPENKGRFIDVFMSPEFLAEAELRGARPEKLMERMMEVTVDLDREAAELFDDWNERTPADREMFLRKGMHARIDLEFPRRED